MREICNSFFSQEIELLETILRIKEDAAMRIIAEMVSAMKAFLTTSSIVGWVGLKPRNVESVGKIKGEKT